MLDTFWEEEDFKLAISNIAHLNDGCGSIVWQRRNLVYHLYRSPKWPYIPTFYFLCFSHVNTLILFVYSWSRVIYVVLAKWQMLLSQDNGNIFSRSQDNETLFSRDNAVIIQCVISILNHFTCVLLLLTATLNVSCNGVIY